MNDMMTPPQREAFELREQGLSQRKIAERLGLTRSTVRSRLAAADRVNRMDPADAARLKANGVGDLSVVHSSWMHNDDVDEEGRRVKGDSTYLYYGKPPEEAQRKFDEIIEELVEAAKDHAPSYAAETEAVVGGHTLDSHLLVIDPADVHIGKLCVKSETGFTFNSEIAVERMKVGVARLVRKARAFGIHRVLFVIGNDILHADRWTNTTTSGTPQDTDGLWHEWFGTARRAYVAMIEEIAHEFTVDLIYTPSNHDWQSGYYLAQTIQAWFHNHPNVNFSDYYASPIHRKYYAYSGGLIGLTHGDGAKENELPNLMQHEARSFWGETTYAYWYLHHWHHKVRTRYGLKPSHVEKDKVGLTIVAPQSNMAGDDVEIEVVRSPSAPDGWHHRNGHINLQAVEVFLHDGSGAQVGRLTEWF
jgi:transcriptional regulator with XRE-family HTH domain